MTDAKNGGNQMSDRKGVVADYIEGSRRTDHAAILASVTDDVVWVIHGYRTLQGPALGAKRSPPTRLRVASERA